MRPRFPRPPRLAGATAARGFRRSWQRAAESLPALGRTGRWAVELCEERPRLAEGPLFGRALGELTSPEPPPREAPRRPERRSARAEMPPGTPPASAGADPGSGKRKRREAAADPAVVRDLPAAASGGEIARWAGEGAVPVASEPPRHPRVRREGPASDPAGDRALVPDPRAVADLRRRLAARSRRPLDVDGMRRKPGETSREERGQVAASPGVTLPGRETRGTESAPASPPPRSPRVAAADLPPATTPGRSEDLSPSSPGGKGSDPWTATLAGARAPRELLDQALDPAADSSAAAGRAPGAPAARRPAPPLRPAERTEGLGGSPLPDLPPTSRDRSDAPAFAPREGHPAPFAPIAPDPVSVSPGPSPLGPFPAAAGEGGELRDSPSAPQALSLLGPYAAPSDPPRAEDLADLAAKIERILADEARRHGIDV